jgi:hypothetical protein
MPENPLVQYLDTTRRRAAARWPLWQKIALILGISLLVAGLGYVYFLDQYSGQPWYAISFEAVVGVLLGCTVVVYMVWLFQASYNMISGGLRLLAAPGKRSVSLQVDDMLSLTRLSDRDILIAALRIQIAPMILPLLAGGLLSLAIILAINSEGFQRFGQEKFWQSLVLGPVTVSAIAFSGLLACLIVLLLSVCFGRGGKVDTAAVASTFLCGSCQVVWLLAGIGIAESMRYDDSNPIDRLSFWIGSLVATLAILAIVGLAEEQSWARRALAQAWPLIVFLGGGFLTVVALMLWTGDPPGWLVTLLAGGFCSLGSLAPINPLSLPTLAVLGSDSPLEPSLLFNPVLSPLAWILRLLLTQLPLCLGLLYFATRAVGLRRKESV